LRAGRAVRPDRDIEDAGSVGERAVAIPNHDQMVATRGHDHAARQFDDEKRGRMRDHQERDVVHCDRWLAAAETLPGDRELRPADRHRTDDPRLRVALGPALALMAGLSILVLAVFS
jgi:hypothetical protein